MHMHRPVYTCTYVWMSIHAYAPARICVYTYSAYTHMLMWSSACAGDACTSVYAQVSIHAWKRMVYVWEPLFVGAAHVMCEPAESTPPHRGPCAAGVQLTQPGFGAPLVVGELMPGFRAWPQSQPAGTNPEAVAVG